MNNLEQKAKAATEKDDNGLVPCICGHKMFVGKHKYRDGHYIVRCGSSGENCIWFPSSGPIDKGDIPKYIEAWNTRSFNPLDLIGRVRDADQARDIVAIINKSRQTHLDWADFFKGNPGEAKNSKYKNIGDETFHRECIERYDKVLDFIAAANPKAILDLIGRVRDLEADVITERIKWSKAAVDVIAELTHKTEALELAELRLDWLDHHTAFVADGEYNIGPYKIGELRKMADAGIAALAPIRECGTCGGSGFKPVSVDAGNIGCQGCWDYGGCHGNAKATCDRWIPCPDCKDKPKTEDGE